jgi:hypothetical protein
MVSPHARFVSSLDGDETHRGKQKLSSVIAIRRRITLSPPRKKTAAKTAKRVFDSTVADRLSRFLGRELLNATKRRSPEIQNKTWLSQAVNEIAPQAV